MAITGDLLEILACPKCKGDLEYRKSEEKLSCKTCARLYEIRDGIPIMLTDEAEIDTLQLRLLHPELPERPRSKSLPNYENTAFTATYFPWSVIMNEGTLKRAILVYRSICFSISILFALQ